MAVPFSSLIPQRSRVLPQGGAVLGQLSAGLSAGFDAGRQWAAEDAAGPLLADYFDLQTGQPAQPTLGSLIASPTGIAAAAGGGDFRPTRENAARYADGAAAAASRDFRPTRQNAATNPGPRTGVDAGVQFLDQFEGFQPTPYEDWSYRPGTGERYMSGMRIGYGQDATGLPSTVTQEQANAALRQQIETQYIPSIIQTIGGDKWAALNADQQGVLISLVHNYGSLPPRILDELAAGDPNATSQAIAGLGGDNSGINRNRRTQEAALFGGTGSVPSATGARTTSTPTYAGGWQPPSEQEKASLRALIVNPATRDWALQEATRRMMPTPDPVVINDRLVDRTTGRVLGDYRTGPVWQNATVNGLAGQQNTQTGQFVPFAASTQATNAPDIHNLIGPDGQLHAYAFNPATQRFDIDQGLADPGGQFSVTTTPDGGVQVIQGRQGTPSGATEGQANANIYATRMEAASPLIDQFTGSGTNFWSGLVSGAGIVGNIVLGQIDPEYQQFAQAVRDFINASLRRESGAVISDSEFASARAQYIPQPGDTPEVLEQKRQNRIRQTEAIRQASGPFAGQGGQAAPDAGPTPITATNPQTGERVQWNGTTWVPVQ